MKIFSPNIAIENLNKIFSYIHPTIQSMRTTLQKHNPPKKQQKESNNPLDTTKKH